jgi:hypothetical protein|tara:strand:+ start:3308 stop:3523 length:216 start_codon:yes stop_codon:yes gene_type:complete
MNTELNEHSILRVYDDFSREQQRIMADIKNGTDNDYIKENEKIVGVLNQLLLGMLKLKNLKIALTKKKEQF